LSFGSSSGRSRSSGKGSKDKKASKKKKQDYHRTKRRSAREDNTDVEKIKARTITALEHLGQQKFSAEPGGYNVQGWVKSLTLLLEDFESKVGADKLPAEYSAAKERVLLEFSKSRDNSELEGKIETLRREEVEIKTKLDRESQRIATRLIEVRNDSERQSKALESEEADLAKLNAERQQASFFSKLLGRRGPETKPVEDKVKELKSLLSALESERESLANARDSIDKRPNPAEDPFGSDWKRIEEVGGQIAQLEAEMNERMQRAEDRSKAATDLTAVIATIPSVKPEEGASAESV
jgi:hypothetical protein